MRLLDIIRAPWAITQAMYDEIQQIYARHMRGEKIDLEILSAQTGINFSAEPPAYQVESGVAIIPIDGVIAKKMNLFAKISGGSSSQLIARDIQQALADRSVEGIVLAIDSPGGTVDGTPELASAIYAARGQKPIIACTDGMMCSAAYWIGSAADEVLISSDVAVVGSIGVVAQHVDVSQAEERRGVKTTEITAGKYKRIASQFAPLTKEGKQTIQDEVDHIYSIFVDTVAVHRGVESGVVLERMADGRTFIGRQAIDAGLVDGVATIGDAVQRALELSRAKRLFRGAGVASATKEKQMTKDDLKQQYPDVVAEIEADATAALAAKSEQDTQKSYDQGRKDELDRIVAVRGQLIPGHEALIDEMAFDGKTTPVQAAMRIIAAEKDLRLQYVAKQQRESNDVIPPSTDEGGQGKTIKRADFDAADQEQRMIWMKEGYQIVD